jgi:ATP-binding cassette subfamily B protein
VAARFTALGDHRLRAVRRDVVLSEGIDAVATNLSTIAVGAILLVIPTAIHQGSFTVGDFALFVSYLTRFAVVTGYVGQYGRIYRQVVVSLRRLEPLLAGGGTRALVDRRPLREPAPVSNSSASEGLPLRSVVVSNLTYRFEGGGGVNEIDLELAAGSFTVITGRVGSGKTTLLRTLLGLLPAQSGRIVWNGEEVERPDLWMVPPRCAFTPQVPRLFTASIVENVLLGEPGGRPAALAAVRTATLEADLEQLRDGIDTAVGPRGMRLSGGQMQRVAAARMLTRNATLMVFDDLSSALDAQTEAELWRRLRHEHPTATLLAVTHRESALQMADQVLHLEHGRLVRPLQPGP